jgi:hypothetical protein
VDDTKHKKTNGLSVHTLLLHGIRCTLKICKGHCDIQNYIFLLFLRLENKKKHLATQFFCGVLCALFPIVKGTPLPLAAVGEQ